MTITQFEVFVTVVETGSFTKTGEKLNMTQSAVSHAVKGLESELGVVLLIRDRRRGLQSRTLGRNSRTHA
ncbi:helix-turn-helix domain-containing protein [Lentibacillus sp. Marseille-P4043]|uniref:LysR family transcriptional regulator n=1 Tax=Lentibacillus sp. Marseille-P4043 TaxID=2040293 RepID=UPI000D0BBAA5